MKTLTIYILVFFLWTQLPPYCEPKEPLNCRAARIDSKPYIEGIIEKKYIQTENHQNRVLEIRQFKIKRYTLYLNPRIHDDFFDFTSVHDTIRKDSHSLTYKIIKPSGEVHSFFLHHGCPDTLSLPR